MQIAQEHSGVFSLSEYMNDNPDAGTNGSSALIGPEGGVVAVADPLSPIFGTFLRVPPGALDAPARITIRKGDHSCDFGLSPSIKLLPDGLQFKRPATLTVYLNNSEAMDEDFDKSIPGFYHYDESNHRWARNSTTNLEQMGDAVMCELHHL
jgi:hypothetical protein